mmetsp:Transcript_3980/g.11358  ORF Transcript_3980/g.11358 Transcript_3980/m.11358 type:complete len:266 (-) Transcript_3980:157-954(-)
MFLTGRVKLSRPGGGRTDMESLLVEEVSGCCFLWAPHLPAPLDCHWPRSDCELIWGAGDALTPGHRRSSSSQASRRSTSPRPLMPVSMSSPSAAEAVSWRDGCAGRAVLGSAWRSALAQLELRYSGRRLKLQLMCMRLWGCISDNLVATCSLSMSRCSSSIAPLCCMCSAKPRSRVHKEGGSKVHNLPRLSRTISPKKGSPSASARVKASTMHASACEVKSESLCQKCSGTLWNKARYLMQATPLAPPAISLATAQRIALTSCGL